MKRLIALLIVGLFTAIAFWFAPKGQSAITLSNAKATPVGTMGGMYMAGVTIQNDGPPATLVEITSPEAEMVSVMNAQAGKAPLVIPGGGSASLAMDGAHIMLRTPADAFPKGALIPLSLHFADGTEVRTQVLNTGAATMDHTAANGVAQTPAPKLALELPNGSEKAGFPLTIKVENFNFAKVPDGSDHVPGQGHAHVYLNGLKLGRAYESSYRIGALSPGSYVLEVMLNTNDHRPYLSQGAAVSQTLEIVIPK